MPKSFSGTEKKAMSIAIQRHVDLQSIHAMGLTAKTNYFAIAKSESEIAEAIDFSRDNKLTVCILGGGSNVIFAGDYSGMVLQIVTKGIQVLAETEKDVLVKVAAGEHWDEFLQLCIKQQWYGLENLAIIPGTVGASPIQNIGAYGQEVASCIDCVTVRDMADWSEKDIPNNECHFSYRDSLFKKALQNKCIITSVTFRLAKTFAANLTYRALAEALDGFDVTNVKNVRDAVIRIRESKLPSPALLPNSGSFFKNPLISSARAASLLKQFPQMPVYLQESGDVKVAAGWLIEYTGWKGKRFGAVGVYDKQALVLVNYAHASYAELQQLVMAIQASVFAQFAISLEQEPLLIKSI